MNHIGIVGFLIVLANMAMVVELRVPFGARLTKGTNQNKTSKVETVVNQTDSKHFKRQAMLPSGGLVERFADHVHINTILLPNDSRNLNRYSANYAHDLLDESSRIVRSRRPILIDSMAALSSHFALPPLTAALPMEQFAFQPITADNGPSTFLHKTSPFYEVRDHAAPSVGIVANQPMNDFRHEIEPIPGVHPNVPVVYDEMKIPKLEPQVYNLHISSNEGKLFQPQSEPTVNEMGLPELHHSNHELLDVDFGVPGIPGRPWKDYPMFMAIPKTNFDCHNVKAGYYADVETGCQVWHYCQLDGRQDAFLCANGTLFNQATRVCDWWYNVDCSRAISQYGVNSDLYRTPPIIAHPRLKANEAHLWGSYSLPTYQLSDDKKKKKK